MTRNNLPILSISGYEGAGKDTLAGLLVPHGFEHLHNIWWIKDATREALRGHVPDEQIEGYVGSDHKLKEIPLNFSPFNDSGTALSTRRWQTLEVEKLPYETRWENNLHGKFLSRTQPQAMTGMREEIALTLWRREAQKHGLPLRFVWIVNPEQGPLSAYDSKPGMFPEMGFWDAVITNPRGNPGAMVESLRRQLPEVDAAIEMSR